MIKRLRYLTAAGAAIGALTLIPLAATSTTAASAASNPTNTAINSTSSTASSNWAGYVDTMKTPSGDNGYDRFKGVTATFKVPAVSCQGSVPGTYPPPPPVPGQSKDYSAVSYWVGLDGNGTDTKSLEQAGIGATCSSKTASPHYYAWYQMDPQQGNVPVTLTVRTGDTIWVSVEDTDGVTPESPKFGNPADTGYAYSVLIEDKTRNTKWSKNGLKPGDGVRAPDATAEVITEAVSNGPYFVSAKAPHYDIGLAQTGTVNYTDVEVTSLHTGWIYAIAMQSNQYWTVAGWNAGHTVWWWFWDINTRKWIHEHYWSSLLGPSQLNGGGEVSWFSTYWH